MEWVWDLLFPKKCVGCGREGGYVCRDCEVGMWEEEQICPACSRNSRYGKRHEYCHGKRELDGLTCFWAYEGLARKLIAGAKYKYFYDQLRYLAGVSAKISARNEFAQLRKFLELKPIVVPVPLHSKRERERGFNQAETIARLFADRYSLIVDSILVRTKDTGQQVGRDRESRLEAIKGAFSINAKCKMANDQILLVDDVWTTGATMSECCKVLKSAGVKTVWGLVLAR